MDPARKEHRVVIPTCRRGWKVNLGSGDKFDYQLFGEYEGGLEFWDGDGAVSDGRLVIWFGR